MVVSEFDPCSGGLFLQSDKKTESTYPFPSLGFTQTEPYFTFTSGPISPNQNMKTFSFSYDAGCDFSLYVY